jgi:hypothetical protein
MGFCRDCAAIPKRWATRQTDYSEVEDKLAEILQHEKYATDGATAQAGLLRQGPSAPVEQNRAEATPTW